MLSPKAIVYDKIRVQTSPEDRMLETVESIQELEREIEDKIHDLMLDQLTAFKMIYSLDSEVYRQVLLLYYMDGNKPKSWNEVADAMGYSESRVKHFHGWALSELEKKTAHESTQKSSKV